MEAGPSGTRTNNLTRSLDEENGEMEVKSDSTPDIAPSAVAETSKKLESDMSGGALPGSVRGGPQQLSMNLPFPSPPRMARQVLSSFVMSRTEISGSMTQLKLLKLSVLTLPWLLLKEMKRTPLLSPDSMCFPSQILLTTAHSFHPLAPSLPCRRWSMWSCSPSSPPSCWGTSIQPNTCCSI